MQTSPTIPTPVTCRKSGHQSAAAVQQSDGLRQVGRERLARPGSRPAEDRDRDRFGGWLAE